jgi:hypothetical protein
VQRRQIRDSRLAWLAFLGGHHVDIARYEGHLLAPAFGAFQFQRFMLGDGFDTFKLLPALLATILVGRHKLKSSNERALANVQFTADGYRREANPDVVAARL